MSANEVLEEIREHERVFGRIPFQDENPRLKRSAIKAFETWNRAVAAAGFRPRRQGVPAGMRGPGGPGFADPKTLAKAIAVRSGKAGLPRSWHGRDA